MKKYLLLAGTVMLAACGPYQLSATERDTTELGALQYANSLSGKFVSCSGQDSDGDSYVTCTISDKDGKPQEILCSYGAGAAGCKMKH